MKILISCLNVNDIGGSELFHYELAKTLHELGQDVTLFSYRDINPNTEIREKLFELNIKQVDRTSISFEREYDIIISSQPQPTFYMLNTFKYTPLINVIHSEIRSEDPILDERVDHYVGIRQSIVDMLTDKYHVNKNKVSLIYNPIDKSRFNSNSAGIKKYSEDLGKTVGLFVGEVLDPIRVQAANHIAKQCIIRDWDLYIMGNQKLNWNHPNIKYLEKRWNTEEIVKKVNFTAGILVGRTTLESWCCNIPSYVYNIDKQGNILDVETEEIPNIRMLCNSDYVAAKYLKLSQKILKSYE